MSTGIGGHHRTVGRIDEWLTPPELLMALGPFDLDPCACVKPPWPTAASMFSIEDDGLSKEWHGRVWLNPPYNRYKISAWMQRMADHGNGIALLFARTDSAWFHDFVFGAADAVLFIKGRLRFRWMDGTKPPGTSGGPSVLIAYGAENVASLERAKIKGALLRIR